jgi:hypothetical protein
MKLIKVLLITLTTLVAATAVAMAGDFGWTEAYNIQAQADPSGFRAEIATRFNLGDAEVRAVLSNFEKPADAYIALRLGEMSGRPISYVVDRYRQDKGNGWGVLAKSLGIKPGSEEFHALKRGHDVYWGKTYSDVTDRDNVPGKSAGKSKSGK